MYLTRHILCRLFLQLQSFCAVRGWSLYGQVSFGFLSLMLSSKQNVKWNTSEQKKPSKRDAPFSLANDLHVCESSFAREGTTQHRFEVRMLHCFWPLSNGMRHSYPYRSRWSPHPWLKRNSSCLKSIKRTYTTKMIKTRMVSTAFLLSRPFWWGILSITMMVFSTSYFVDLVRGYTLPRRKAESLTRAIRLIPPTLPIGWRINRNGCHWHTPTLYFQCVLHVQH